MCLKLWIAQVVEAPEACCLSMIQVEFEMGFEYVGELEPRLLFELTPF